MIEHDCYILYSILHHTKLLLHYHYQVMSFLEIYILMIHLLLVYLITKLQMVGWEFKVSQNQLVFVFVFLLFCN